LFSLCQTCAFLVLYGFWLGCGQLDAASGCVCFEAAQQQEADYLRGLFARLQLPQLAVAAAGAHGFCVSASNEFTICSQRWSDYFAAEQAAAPAAERS